MRSRQHSPTHGDHPHSGPAGAARPKPLRFRIGVGLLILYPLMWAFAAVVPFLALDAGVKAAVIAGDLAAAEGIGILGVACVGKETYQAIKSRLRRRNRRTPTAPDAE